MVAQSGMRGSHSAAASDTIGGVGESHILPDMRTLHIVISFAVAAGVIAGCGTAATSATTAAVDAQATAGADSGAASADTAKADAVKADTSGTTDTKPTATPPPCKPWDAPADWKCPADTHCGYDQADVIDCLPNGTHGVAEDCSDGQGCKIGACVTSDNGAQLCSPYCSVDGHCDSNMCNKLQNSKAKVCDVTKYTACSPLASKCESGLGCYPASGIGFACLKAGTKTNGEPCAKENDCAPGFACAGLGGASGLCRTICSKTAKPNGCPDPATNCSSLSGNYGYCEE